MALREEGTKPFWNIVHRGLHLIQNPESGTMSQDKELTWLQIPDFWLNAVPAAQCSKMASYPPLLVTFVWTFFSCSTFNQKSHMVVIWVFFNFSGQNSGIHQKCSWIYYLCIFRTYYQCQANGAKRGGYEAVLKHCAAGTAFDPKSGICNHVSSLSCEKEPSQSLDIFETRGTFRSWKLYLKLNFLPWEFLLVKKVGNRKN